MEMAKYTPIKDYAYIGDGRSAALVSKDGSIDWLCWPRFDSPSIFGALLDVIQGGFWKIAPKDYNLTKRNYRKNTLVLETVFQCDHGVIKLTDCMPVAFGRSSRHLSPEQELIRCIECIAGTVEISVLFLPAPDFGLTRVKYYRYDKSSLRFNCNSGTLLLVSDMYIDETTGRGSVHLNQGECRYMSLSFTRDNPLIFPLLEHCIKNRIDQTANGWSNWSNTCTYDGPYKEMVLRSAIVLKSLIYSPSGAIVAAPTTSLPEKIGGKFNWDYRFCWLRDSALTIRALTGLGFHQEAFAFGSWLLYTTRLTRPRLQPLYDVYGGLARWEKVQSHLDGFRSSRPVRTGNAAAFQTQLDIYGEVISAVTLAQPEDRPTDRETEKMLLSFGKYICKTWKEPDEGIWESRSGKTQHTLSKVLCWAGLDNLVSLQKRSLISDKHHDLFTSTMALLRQAIEKNSYNVKMGIYTQNFGDTSLDLSVLMMSWYGFESAQTERMQSTFRVLSSKLHANGGLYHRNEQSMKRSEGTFGICSFWISEFLAKGGGTLLHAKEQFERVLQYANDCGLFSEEIDAGSGEFLGNFPQAFTHIGLINTALSIEEAGQVQ
jgi:GH15 family glucan-1,4-alpha-glucosidase